MEPTTDLCDCGRGIESNASHCPACNRLTLRASVRVMRVSGVALAMLGLGGVILPVIPRLAFAADLTAGMDPKALFTFSLGTTAMGLLLLLGARPLAKILRKYVRAPASGDHHDGDATDFDELD